MNEYPGKGHKIYSECCRTRIKNFTKAIMHGDEKHQEWLKTAAHQFINGEEIMVLKFRRMNDV